MKRVGIIGKGYWGQKLSEKLGRLAYVKFLTGSSDYERLYKNFPANELDWVFIATPNNTHFDIAKHWLDKGVNVFCEKPLSLSTDQSKELFKIADKNNCLLYVDDVFRFRDEMVDIKTQLEVKTELDNYISVIWTKPSRTGYGSYVKSNLYNLMWHDLYVLYKFLGDITPVDIKVVEKYKNLSFIISFENGITIDFIYDRQSESTIHSIETVSLKRTLQDPLADMIETVLSESKSEFKFNKKSVMFCHKIIDWVSAKIYPKTVAVVGGGIFGTTTAATLAKAGYNVTLFEQKSSLLACASGINQYRIHRGYHYPRSKETAQLSLDSMDDFIDVYGEAVANREWDKTMYLISKKQSKVNAYEYMNFMDQLGLEYHKTDWQVINWDEVSLAVHADEKIFDPFKLAKIASENLEKYDVDVRLSTTFTPIDADEYDYVINSAYANLNMLLPEDEQIDLQFELCEKPVVKLPPEFKGKSAVVMDGPFMCFDPFGDDGEFHVLGNVVHAIHSTNVGKYPVIPPAYLPLLNNGIVNSGLSKIEHFAWAGERFFKGFHDLMHIGSMYTFRTVLPARDYDDARPTRVKQINDKLVYVFSGKIPTCVTAAKEVLDILKETDNDILENIQESAVSDS